MGPKNFCFYDHPNVVIVDLPTIVGRKAFFQKFTKWLIDSLIRLFGPEKILLLWTHFPTIADRKWFFKNLTKWLIGTPKRLFRLKKSFQLWAPDYSDSWFADYGKLKMIFSKIHKMTYWYPKTLIWAWKKFCSCGPPTIVIVDLPTMVSWNWFFQKFTKWLISTWGRLFWPKKNFWLWPPDYSDSWFADYGGSKTIFSKIHQMAYWYP